MNYKGNPVSGGVVVGKVFRYIPYVPKVEEREIEAGEVQLALDRLAASKETVRAELEGIRASLQASDPEKAKIFTAHIDILYDVAIDEEVREKIEEDRYDVEWAVDKVFGKYTRMMEKAKDELLRERAVDLRDVRTRLLRCCSGAPDTNLSRLPGPVIVVADDLFPSDTASMDRKNVLGIVTQVGGSTSHTAIIARSYGILALLGVQNALANLADGQEIVLDAVGGEVVCEPTNAQKAEYAAKGEAYRVKMAEVAKYIDKEPVTADGVRIEVHLNIGAAGAEELQGEAVAQGVGLFRTEFLYMNSDHLPGEEEQYAAYRKVLLQFGEKPVILRTLDIGGDKQLEALPLPAEQNPFLGNRALRLCFSMPQLFQTQLRAALRASAEGNLWLMFPMVGSLEDLRRAKAAVRAAMESLDAEGIAYKKDVKLGIMVEIPSIALIADMVAQEADFASIGTNDLCQYATAVDRLNPAVAEYYQSYHPAMFRLIGQVVRAFNKVGKTVSVCGEMGGDPLAVPVLVGLGMRKLSMNHSAVAECKKVITHLRIKEAEALAEEVCGMGAAGEIKDLLKKQYDSIG